MESDLGRIGRIFRVGKRWVRLPVWLSARTGILTMVFTVFSPELKKVHGT